MDQKICEQGRGPARAAFVRTTLIRGSGDVEMRPFEPLSEFTEECRRRDGSALTSSDIREIREVALQLLAVLLREWQVPGPIIGAQAGFHKLVHETFVVAHCAG